MGITKQYLRYASGSVFGIIGSGTQIHLVTRSSQKGKFVVVPAAEFVYLWNLRTNTKVLSLHCEEVKGIVTALEPRPPIGGLIDNTSIAVGYSDGSVVLYDLNIGQPLKFNGHKKGVSSVAWDPQGMRAASASDDGEIVLWDVVSERGIIRLKDHRGRINKIRFLETRNMLISCGSDLKIRFWDLDVNFCFFSLVVPSTKICDFLILKNDTRLLTGGDGNLTVWKVKYLQDMEDEPDIDALEITDTKEEPASKILKTEKDLTPDDEEERNRYMKVTVLGHLTRSRSSRICGLASDGRAIVVQDRSANLDRYLILNEEERQAKITKRLKKEKKRLKDGSPETEDEIHLTDEIKKIASFKTPGKVNGLSVITLPGDTIITAALQADNSIVVSTSYSNSNSKDSQDVDERMENRRLGGHKTEIRAIAINLLGDQIITASADSLKVWNRRSKDEIKSIECDYPLSLLLPPGDRHVLLGTKSGKLQLYDINSGALLEDLLVHTGTEAEEKGIWALALTHNGKGFVSGGSDSIVKFWNFELIDDESGRGKRLSIFQDTKALQVADQITSLKCSGCGKFLAVATFDLKETIYYIDTLKLLHEFYGYSMPSTCLDFSTDSSMMISGNKDCCIRIYATDFGDRKRLLKNCHQGGVTDVRFVPNTHLFFSCGNDGTVKQWDADNFQRIFTLTGHHGIVKCLAISFKGNFVATSGKDRSIRIWDKTNEPLILDDEREEERKRQEEEFLGGTLQAPVVAGEETASAVRPTLFTQDTEKAADALIEALRIYEEVANGEGDTKNQLMTLVYKTDDPLRFVFLVIKKIKSSELEEAILVLPLNLIMILLVCVKGFLRKGWDNMLSSRVLLVATRVNMHQITHSKDFVSLMRDLQNTASRTGQIDEDKAGFNAAGIDYYLNRIKKKKESSLLVEAAQAYKDNRRKKNKRQRIIKRALIAL